jgi:ADP-heptose:LPS heptosyltransferase
MAKFNTRSGLAKSHTSRLIYWLMVLGPIDRLAMLMSGKHRRPGKKRVLFTRLDGIGDFVIWTASFEAIRDIYPDDEFDRILVGNELWQDLVDPTMFAESIFVNTKAFIMAPGYRLRKMREIRRIDADVAVNPRLTREFLWNDSVIRVSRAAERIGTHGISNRMTPLQKRISDRWYTKLTAEPRDGDHELLSNAAFLSEVAGDRAFELSRPSIASGENPFPSLKTRGYAVYFVGAQIGDKQWPVERFADAAIRIRDRHGLNIVVAGGPDDLGIAREFENLLGEGVDNIVGKTSLPELSAIIGDAGLVVTNDTGAGHLGVAHDVPTVVITPGNHIGRFFPYPAEIGGEVIKQSSAIHEMPCFGCRWDCIFIDARIDEPTPCVANVGVDDVMRAVEKVIQEVKRSGVLGIV